jgi:hypothetical protein
MCHQNTRRFSVERYFSHNSVEASKNERRKTKTKKEENEKKKIEIRKIYNP